MGAHLWRATTDSCSDWASWAKPQECFQGYSGYSVTTRDRSVLSRVVPAWKVKRTLLAYMVCLALTLNVCWMLTVTFLEAVPKTAWTFLKFTVLKQCVIISSGSLRQHFPITGPHKSLSSPSVFAISCLFQSFFIRFPLAAFSICLWTFRVSPFNITMS